MQPKARYSTLPRRGGNAGGGTLKSSARRCTNGSKAAGIRLYNLDALDAGVDTPPEEGSTPTSVTLPLARDATARGDRSQGRSSEPERAGALTGEVLEQTEADPDTEPPPWEKYLDAETVETPAAAKPDAPAAELADPEDVDARATYDDRPNRKKPSNSLRASIAIRARARGPQDAVPMML